jgi:hypothetical protein
MEESEDGEGKVYLDVDVVDGFVIALLRLLRLVASPYVAENPLDGAVALVESHQLVGNFRMDEVYVQRLVPTDEHVLLL